MACRFPPWTLAALLLAGLSAGPGLAHGAEEGAGVVDRVPSEPALKAGDPAPAWDAVDPQGRDVHLSTFRGRPVLLDFGSVFCMDCRSAIAYLEGVWGRYGPVGLNVVMIVVDGARAAGAADRCRAELGATFPVLFDVMWRTGSSYGVEMIPSQFLIDGEGIIRGTHVGFDEKMVPDDLIRSVLSEQE